MVPNRRVNLVVREAELVFVGAKDRFDSSTQWP